MTNNYDDEAWVSHIKFRAAIHSGYHTGIATSNLNRDFNTLIRLSELLTEEIELTIREDDNYNLSPRFKEANMEWIAGLHAYNSGAKYARIIAIDAQNGNVNTDDISEFVNFNKQGTEHIENVLQLIS
jgi:hypothetical protein